LRQTQNVRFNQADEVRPVSMRRRQMPEAMQNATGSWDVPGPHVEGLVLVSHARSSPLPQRRSYSSQLSMSHYR